MKTSKNVISALIHQAILRRKLPKLEERLFADLLNYYVTNNPGSDSETEERIIALLNSEVAEKPNRKNKLNNPQSFNSLGDYLKIFLEEYSIDGELLCQNCKIERVFFSQFLENKIKILDFGPKKIAQLVKYLNLKIEVVKELLIKTIWLNSQNITIKNTLARYAPDKGLDKKDKSMTLGLKELLYKANKTKPLSQSNPQIDALTANFLSEFENYYNKL